jgi:hypothetical protein
MIFDQMMEDLSAMEGIEAIALGDPGASEKKKRSEYDVYAYYTSLPDEESRKRVLGGYTIRLEQEERFGEPSDEAILSDGGIVYIVYRRLDEFDEAVSGVVERCEASTGYTTCRWHKLLHSSILYDPKGRYAALQKKYQVPYPERLKRNILLKNMRLLSRNISSCDKQIEKAMERRDPVSVNHWAEAFMASYLDVIFAINELTHPGVENQISYALQHAKYLPEKFEENIQMFFEDLYTNPDKVMADMECIHKNLGEELQRYIAVNEKYRPKA